MCVVFSKEVTEAGFLGDVPTELVSDGPVVGRVSVIGTGVYGLVVGFRKDVTGAVFLSNVATESVPNGRPVAQVYDFLT